MKTHGPVTGRMSCSKPNVASVPKDWTRDFDGWVESIEKAKIREGLTDDEKVADELSEGAVVDTRFVRKGCEKYEPRMVEDKERNYIQENERYGKYGESV